MIDLNAVVLPGEGRDGFCIGAGGTLLATRDGGNSWQRTEIPTDADLYGLCFLEDMRAGFVVGDRGTVLRSTDAGTTWHRIDAGTESDLRGICFPTERAGFLVGAGGLAMRSDDRGESWQRQPTPTTADLLAVTFPVDEETGFAVGAAGTIIRNVPGHDHWFLAGEPGASGRHDLRGVFFPQSNTFGFVVGASGTLLRTEDGGDSWRAMDPPVPYVGYCAVQFPLGPELGIAVGDAGTVIRTDDGQNWSPVFSDTTDDLLGLDFRPDGVLACCCGRHARILVSGDAGQSWTEPASVEF